MLRRTRLFWIVSFFLATGLFIAVVRAQADPLPAAYSGTTQADLLALNTDPAGLQVGASIGRSATTVDSTRVPRAHAESANLEPKAAGVPVGVASASAHAGNSNPTGSYDSPLGPVDIPSLLTTGAVTGTGRAKWASDIQCLTRPISTSTTTLAGADLGSRLSAVIDRRILHLGTVASTGDTTLRNGSVVSTRSGDLSDSTLLGGRVGLHVVTNPTLTATSNGTTGRVSANHYAVQVTVGQSAPVTLHAGDSLPIKVDLGTTTADLTLAIGTLTDTSAGVTASGTITFIRVSGTISTLLGTQTQVDLRLLRLNATATGSPGGVRCNALDAPVITTPASGTTTTKFPAITGTGLPGTTVTAFDGGTKLGATTTDGDGNWSLTPATALRIGRHSISATQATSTAHSARSKRVAITVPDTRAPAPPVITTPSDRSGTSTDVTTVGGTGEPGAKVGVSIDGRTLGTTTVGAGGTWSIRVGRPLADGSHTASATQTDRSGNRSGDARSTFTVGASTPAAPVITEPANDSLTDSSTPTIAGRAVPGAAVTVTDATGSKLGATTALPDGTWSLDSHALHDGAHKITARATSTAGVASAVSAPVAFSIDTWLPIAPVITRPTDGVTLVRSTPEISGTGEPGDTVEVIIEASTVGTAKVAQDGSWNVLRTAPLPDGTHIITATQTDPAGNTSPIATPLSFRVDTTAPAPPEIVTPASGQFTNDRSPAISGTAEPGSRVEITTGDGRRLGVVRTAADGTWSLKHVHLHDGGYALTATATDEVGNTSADSSPVVLTVDTAAPAAPTVKGLTGPTGTTTIADSSPAISGRGEPGASVTVTVDGRLVGMTVVGGDGSWWLPTARFADGRHKVTATQTDLANNISRASHPVIFISDSTPPKAPVITSPAGGAPIPERLPTVSGTGEPKATVIVTIDGRRIGTAITARNGVWSIRARTPLADGRHKIIAIQTDAAANASVPAKSTFRIDATPPKAPVIANPAGGSVLADNTPTVSGTADPGSVVIISDAAGSQLGTATVGHSGSWSIGSARLHDGRYKITAVATDAAGNVSPGSDPKAFTVDSTAPAAPVIDGPVDRSTSADPVPLITGTGEPGTTVRVIIDNSVAGTVTVGGYGTWSLKPAARLADGDHTVTATQSDAAGNTSPVSDRVLFAVDTTAPAAAVINSPAAGGLIADPAPVISGTAEPGTSVIITMGRTRLGSTQVGADGRWSLRPPVLTDGSHTVTATVIDKAKNSSPLSAPVTFAIDTAAPGAPVVSRPASGAAVNDSTPTLSGTGEPGATVAVRVDGTLVGTVKVAPDDSWTLASTALTDGDHTLIAAQTDPAGNTSQPSARVGFTVDTHAAAAPVIQSPADGTVTADRNPIISGTGERGDTVKVTDAAGKIVATGSVDASGHWSFPSSELADGTYSITVRQTDAAGNTSGPATSTFTVDAKAPAAPVISKPAAGLVSSDKAPTIGGTGEPGAVVSVIIDSTEVGTAVVGADGSWTVPSSTLADGDHKLTATQTDEAGNTSPGSGPVSFTIDTTPPPVPLITRPADGSALADSAPMITGTGTPDQTVRVRIDGHQAGSTAVGADGRWNLTPSTPLADGDHRLTATQTDAAGNTSPASDQVQFAVDTTAPAAAVINSPAPGAAIPDRSPAISGTAEPGTTVILRLGNGTRLGSATAGRGGGWSLRASALKDGNHTITATVVDEAKNTSPVSAPVSFTVDTTAPAAPVVTRPADGAAGNDSTPTVAGTGEPGATVAVTVDGSVVGTVTAAADHNWSLALGSKLADGDHTVIANQTDPAGNASQTSAPVRFSIDTHAAAAPVIQSPADGTVTADPRPTISGTGERGDRVTVTDATGNVVATGSVNASGDWSLASSELSDGSYSITVRQTDAAGNTSGPATSTFTVDSTAPAAPVINAPAAGWVSNDNAPTVGGTGEPGAVVSVIIDSTEVGTAMVAADGTWTVPSSTLADGDHTVTATQTDEAGNTSPASNSMSFTIDTRASAPPVITGPKAGSTIGDNTPLITGTGAPNQTVAVTIDGRSVGSVTVGSDKTWSLQLPARLAEGDHTVTATQTDAAGNTSGASAPVTFTVDAVPPAAPVITSPHRGALLADPTPMITGTAEPGSTVTIRSDGTKIGTATAAGDGSWTLQPTASLSDGDHSLTGTATDRAGNTGAASVPLALTIDSTPPQPPVIFRPVSHSVTGDPTPPVRGSGEPRGKITVTLDGKVLGSTSVADDGTWRVPVSRKIADGDHTVTAIETDAAGNRSARSQPDSFVVDTTAPHPPVITGPADGSTTRDRTPAIFGTGEPGATVTVTERGGTILGITQVGDDGSWSFEAVTPADRSYRITAVQTDYGANTSTESRPVTFTVDTRAPAVPMITDPGNGVSIAHDTLTVRGTAAPGSTITVAVDGAAAGTTAPDAAGRWSVAISRPIGEGGHTIGATATDPAGNTSAADQIAVTVDTSVGAPKIAGPIEGSTVADQRPVITGIGEPGAIVTVTVDHTRVGTALVDANGNWVLQVVKALASGRHTIAATQTDAAGNVSRPAESSFLSMLTARPVPPPVITGPQPGQQVDDAMPRISGTGRPGATIRVIQDGTTVGSTTVDATGTWSVTLGTQTCGRHTVQVVQGAGQTPGRSTLSTMVISSRPSAAVAYQVGCQLGGGNPAGGSTPNAGGATLFAPVAGLGFLALLGAVALLIRRRG